MLYNKILFILLHLKYKCVWTANGEGSYAVVEIKFIFLELKLVNNFKHKIFSDLLQFCWFVTTTKNIYLVKKALEACNVQNKLALAV